MTLPDHLLPEPFERKAEEPAMPAQGPVVAAVIWYRQKDARLEKMVKSLKGRADGLVALDGVFTGLSETEGSPDSNYAALHETARAIDLMHYIYGPRPGGWSGEPQKRTAAATAARELADEHWPGEQPWVLVLDSDEWLRTKIDWSKVLPIGRGTGALATYQDGKRRKGWAGDGNKMVRLYPNEDLLWGPAHFDVRGAWDNLPVTYSGWEKHLTNEDEPAFTIGHDFGEKIIQVEYDAYNDRQRIAAEGRMLRVIQDYTTGGPIVLRMDQETALASDFTEGMVMTFGADIMAEPEQRYSECVEIVPTPGLEDLTFDMTFEKLADEEAKSKIEAHARVELARRQTRERALAARIQKRSRKWDQVLKQKGRR